MSSEPERTAISILGEFEELLAEKDTKVPSADRQGGPEEACLYGSEYYALEEGVVGVMIESAAGKTRGADAGSPALPGS